MGPSENQTPNNNEDEHHQHSQYMARSTGPRASFASARTTSTSTTLTSALMGPQPNNEMYSGATFETVPSSIVSFHHPQSFQSSNIFGTSLTSSSIGRRGRTSADIDRETDSAPLISPSREISRSPSRNPRFNFFTEDQINSAEGTSTLENTDFNTPWDATPSYEQDKIYASSELNSRRSSIYSNFSRRPSLSHSRNHDFHENTSEYGTSSYHGVPLTRISKTRDDTHNYEQEQQHTMHPPEVYQASTHSSSSLSRYTIADRIPVELEEQNDELMDGTRSPTHSLSESNSDRSFQESTDGGNNFGTESETHSHHKKQAYQSSSGTDSQNEYLKPKYHEKLYPNHPTDLYYQRFYIAEEDLVVGIAGYKTSKIRKQVYNLFCILTGGLLYLLFRWLPTYKVLFIGSKVPLGRAEWVILENEFGDFDIQSIDRRWYNRPISTLLPIDDKEQENNDEVYNRHHYHHYHHVNENNPNIPILISFKYRYITFIYSPVGDMFKTNNNWVDPDWVDVPSVLRGLSSAVQEDRVLAFDKNQINLEVKTISELLFNEVLHPFYIFQIFSIILWSLDEYYYYAGCIFLISILSIMDTLIETRKTQESLAQMSHFSCEIRVFRDEFWTTINSADLVPGDIYEISDPSLTIFPCDSILLSGDCIVNESMLTGESVPVSKSPASQDTLYQLIDDFQNVQISNFVSKSFLFNGTGIIRARIPHGQSAALAMVVRTGFSTTKGSLVRSMVFPRPTGFKFYQDSFKYIGVMAIIALFGFSISCIEFIKIGLDKRTMILRALDIITIVVPPALPATLTIGTGFSLARLKKKGIFCISPTRVNIGGKIDIMCFDKTGTMTENGLDVLGVQLSKPISHNEFKFGEFVQDVHQLFSKISLNDCNSAQDYRARNFFMSLLTCHSLRMVDDELIGDPLDFKMFQFTGWSYEENFQNKQFHSTYEERRKTPTLPENIDIIPVVVHPNGKDPKNIFIDNDPHNFLGIVRSFEFLAELRRMSVIVKPNSDDVYWSFTKGAPEIIAEICNKATLPSDFEDTLQYYTHNGYRVIACAGKVLPKNTWLYSQKISREEVESGLEFLGFIVFENKLKPSTRDTLDVLQDANIRTVMCTGDNVLTAVSVARQSGLVKANHVYVPMLTDAVLEDEIPILWREVDDQDNILDGRTLKPIDSFSDYTLAITGDIFRLIFSGGSDIPEAYISEVLLKGSVYARMSPDEKHELMEQLQKLDYTVGFCGDGANDCGALKAADVGISLSEAEASVAAPFTSKIFEISCVLDVIKEGRACLVTSFSCFQYMSLYSAIQFITITILYSRGSNLGDFQFLYIDLLLIIPIAIFMSWSKPYDKIVKKRPSANLISAKILVPLLASIIIILLFQVIPWQIVQKMGWYLKPVVGGDDLVESSDNTILFYISNFQYILTAIVLSVGRPYREPMSKNHGFIIDITVSLLLNLCLMFMDPHSYLGKKFQLTPVSTRFKLFIVVWALLNYYVQLYIPTSLKKYFKKRKSGKKYKNILQEKSMSFVV
ncbi:putative acid anhydride hydrolase NDAI_0E00730 [Naumovozyma dairenensis CBS 421]|uniref:Cation-transporting ATPase n=1 Tax=Naumovozyma dairenensis (strain ATCC 10597 / BCRC 20456 / CBS 421 / NBRC 0211 / NRRL Y-12639) TaxID=1071378 RepID=G0WAW9_NAUDC|nr:hypothetical protein NDAI_0E00730 [Naumovozyma dairenensis CBS 421]CCD24889.1 hypothetical protein NDAI_0E00730 [Naumovozyma dairenensis CBS 421]